MRFKFWGLALLTILAAGACSKKDSSDPAASTALAIDLKLQAANRGALSLYDDNYSLAVGAEASSFVCKKTDRTTTGADSVYSAQYGSSGAPTSMTIYLKSITLSSEQHGTAGVVFQSPDANGTALVMSNGEVDLSGLVLATSILDATYNRMTAVFANEAKITGCITEQYQSNNGECDGMATGLCEAFDVDAAETQTYCTKSAYDTFDILSAGSTVARSVYTGAAEEMSVPLNMRFSDGSSIGEKTADVSFDFSLSKPVIVGTGTGNFDASEEDEPVTVANNLTLSMVLDMNLLLGFDGNARKETVHPFSGAVGDAKAAYFHTKYLPDFMRIFVGEVGSIEGYHADFCYGFTSSDWRHVKEWVTVIFDESGALLGGTITPYDDAGMTLLKGTIQSESHATYPSTKSGTTYKLNLTRLFSGNVEASFLGSFNRLTSVGDADAIDATASGQTSFNQTEASGSADGTTFSTYIDYVRKL